MDLSYEESCDSMANYIQEIRALVGHKPLLLNTAAGILVNDQQQVLLNLRTDTHDWSLPGGYLEYGETFAEACVREYREDSGVDVEIVAPIGLFDRGETVYPNGDVTQTISRLFLVRAVGGHVLDEATDETVRLDYFDFDNLPPLMNQQTADMLAAAAEFIKK
ncbi:NTP pyrophosphohydrolase [Lactobacillus plantarum JDM1] [Lactiplantibacillus mudanjiangensis]|uniref:NTP pyrophosphohydrolase [Lactobacillus plantarum JDM1] n=2 Tax=Lactiplantibacillus mudanjiangensis TaxID=1296538 RepID=A0A660E3V8_9LACO|nr:NTP pyrophosphohydrolase [Lactobacillus plantarum JDM1] [Lactiplantibacillus mudanjiangensis]VDG22784.1 NTP pyrophosphohydrolase [Lactobacillus plantarum JDM1] [Lactiplantibacillus mudanjiangensis]VDG26646.1 NTP pyrophosphohydrolase [Lactobacillus plantarum JDM1] [Lactiplantibacillus mudanjiangensis]VDG31878.1 NTP pyrophosphohydrolase [Lactobacillus plantarum JDM1] [Lactiplantibacillus mudanjiangensis]